MIFGNTVCILILDQRGLHFDRTVYGAGDVGRVVVFELVHEVGDDLALAVRGGDRELGVEEEGGHAAPRPQEEPPARAVGTFSEVEQVLTQNCPATN